MKLRRIRKNAFYAFAYGSSKKRFKKLVRSSPDKGISRIPARQLKSLMNAVVSILSLPPGDCRMAALIESRRGNKK